MGTEVEALQAFNTFMDLIKYAIGGWVVFMILFSVIRLGRILEEVKQLNIEFNKYFRWAYNKGNEKEEKKQE